LKLKPYYGKIALFSNNDLLWGDMSNLIRRFFGFKHPGYYEDLIVAGAERDSDRDLRLVNALHDEAEKACLALSAPHKEEKIQNWARMVDDLASKHGAKFAVMACKDASEEDKGKFLGELWDQIGASFLKYYDAVVGAHPALVVETAGKVLANNKHLILVKGERRFSNPDQEALGINLVHTIVTHADKAGPQTAVEALKLAHWHVLDRNPMGLLADSIKEKLVHHKKLLTAQQKETKAAQRFSTAYRNVCYVVINRDKPLLQWKWRGVQYGLY
jgi:hypothetical protein